MNISIIIILICVMIFLIPFFVVLGILAVCKRNRGRKKEEYMGKTQGRIMRIVHNGLDFPWVIHVQYEVDGMTYEIKETAKLKVSSIKVAGIPIGQRQSFVLGAVREGDLLEIRYDLQHPEKAIIYRNDGMIS